jgi:hypothetical protein
MNEQAMKGLAEYREKVASGEIEVVRLNPIEKAKNNPKSLRLAIDAQCFDCMGRTGSTSDIRECTAKDCPLYPVRSYR